MRSRISCAIQRLRPTTAIALLALFLAIGGGTAIALDGQNTVFSDDIVAGEVKAPDVVDTGLLAVRPNPITSTDPCLSRQTGIFCGTDSVSGLRGWKNLGSGYAPVRYSRDVTGEVRLQGTMVEPQSATQSTQAFILPAGYRPSGTLEFAVAYGQKEVCSGGSGCDERLTVLRIEPDGDVYPAGGPGTGTNYFEGVALDGVVFQAAP